MGFPGGPDGKESACNAEDPGSIRGLGRSLEKRIALHSSILTWRISQTEKPGVLQSMGLQKVEHNLATFTFISSLVRCLLKSVAHFLTRILFPYC